MPIVADVINLQISRDGAPQEFIGEPMCSNELLSIPECAVSSSVDGSCPIPTARWVPLDFSPEALFGLSPHGPPFPHAPFPLAEVAGRFHEPQCPLLQQDPGIGEALHALPADCLFNFHLSSAYPSRATCMRGTPLVEYPCGMTTCGGSAGTDIGAAAGVRHRSGPRGVLVAEAHCRRTLL